MAGKNRSCVDKVFVQSEHDIHALFETDHLSQAGPFLHASLCQEYQPVGITIFDNLFCLALIFKIYKY